MNHKPTNELDKLLENIKPEQLDNYYAENKQYMSNSDKAFSFYMKDTIASKGLTCGGGKMKLRDIYSFAGVSESYGEKILNMEKHTKDRDLILRFCVVARFSVEETNRALKLYGMKPLYAKEKRDACIIVAINNRKYDLIAMDELLKKQGFEGISSKEL